MKPCVFIHTNHKQHLGALVSLHSMRRNSRHADEFDVKLIEYETYQDFFAKYEGRTYSRDGDNRVWDNDDLQSFTPLRFMPPELMGYEGRAVVVDPDVFAVRTSGSCCRRDMQGKAIMCRQRGRRRRRLRLQRHAARLRQAQALAAARRISTRCSRCKRDYKDWMNLGYEDQDTIGAVRARVERFRQADRRDQDDPQYAAQDAAVEDRPAGRLHPGREQPAQPGDAVQPPAAQAVRRVRAFLGNYKAHPDERQTQLFFGYLKECLANGLVTEALVKEHMAANHVRHDAFEVIERTPPIENVLPKAA